LRDYERVQRLLGAYPYAALRNFRYRTKVAAILSADFRREVEQQFSLEALAAVLPMLRTPLRSSVAATAYVGIKTDLPNYILNNLGDRQEMAHSVEGRVPFLDHQVAELALGMDWDSQAESGKNKHALRHAMQKAGCRTVTAPKKVFLAPPLPGLPLGHRNSLAARYLSPQAVSEAGIFSAARITAIRSALLATSRGSYWRGVLENVLVAVVSIQILHTLFCRDFSGSVERYRKTGLDYCMKRGRVLAPSSNSEVPLRGRIGH
jgi:asparagine synthase (glutamine-hydrolysing)